MVFKDYRFNIVFRCVLLAATLFMLGFLLQISLLLVPALLLVAAVGQVVLLVRYVEKPNQEMADFLEALHQSDYSHSYKSPITGKTFSRIDHACNSITHAFKKLRAEKEEHFFYLQNIIQHIGIAIIAYRQDGSVEMINNASQKLFQLKGIKNINELNAWSHRFVELLTKMKAGENTLIKIQDKDELLQLAVYATEFRINERHITLVSVKNIQAELEEQEMEAWQKLIRALTREIMNSVAPISSLADTTHGLVCQLAQSVQAHHMALEETDTFDDIQQALKTIDKRSTELIRFVETYRNLARIPKPNFAIFPVKKLFKHLQACMQEEFDAYNIAFTYHVQPESIVLTADELLLEQVLLNMLRNASQALQETTDGKIQLKAFATPRGRTVIQVIDNGSGLADEVKDKVFIPFFSTKREGSGIGLSLSRQIIRQHNGTITVQSDPHAKTCFTITL